MIVDKNGDVFAEEDDQCYSCNFFDNERRLCPLVEAFMAGVAQLTPQYEEGIAVTNCDFYKDKFSLDLLQLPTKE